MDMNLKIFLHFLIPKKLKFIKQYWKEIVLILSFFKNKLSKVLIKNLNSHLLKIYLNFCQHLTFPRKIKNNISTSNLFYLFHLFYIFQFKFRAL